MDVNAGQADAPVMMSTTVEFTDIREAVAKVCQQFPQSYWRELDEKDAYPTEFVKAVTDAGFLAALIPEEYGGSGLPLRAAAAILEEMNAEGCHAAACHAQMYIMGALLRHGSDAQKKKYLPGIAAGELRLQAFGITEPTTGSDTTKLKTRAEKKGDKYIINGQKVWTSRALHSDLMLLLARTTPVDQVKKKIDGLSVFLVDIRESRGKGLDIKPIKAMINHNTCEVFFDNLEVPAENLIGEEGKGFRYILDGMNAERVLVSAGAIGSARWFMKTASAYVKERVVFGRPIGQNQSIQFPIARAYVELQSGILMTRLAASLFEAGKPCGAEANMSKLITSEALWNAAEATLQAHGGFGFATEYNVERKWREARLGRVAPVSTNLILAFIGEHVLGMPRTY